MKENHVAKIVLSFVFGLFLTHPLKANAWSEKSEHHHKRIPRHYDHHHHHPFGFHVSVLPRHYITISIGNLLYFYCDGVFYQKFNQNYVVVSAPIGAVVRNLPLNCSRIRISGKNYYVSNDTYYVFVPRGYQVVPNPEYVSIDPDSDQILLRSDVTSTREIFTVSISNSQGGHTPVIIKKSNDGYLGPQGEFYFEFPKVDQLKAMYVK